MQVWLIGFDDEDLELVEDVLAGCELVAFVSMMDAAMSDVRPDAIVFDVGGLGYCSGEAPDVCREVARVVDGHESAAIFVWSCVMAWSGDVLAHVRERSGVGHIAQLPEEHVRWPAIMRAHGLEIGE